MRAEVWKFILGYWPLNSTFEEQQSIREQKEAEYCSLKMKWIALSEDETEVEDLDGSLKDLPMTQENIP